MQPAGQMFFLTRPDLCLGLNLYLFFSLFLFFTQEVQEFGGEGKVGPADSDSWGPILMDFSNESTD
jgi:hypothetical protein